MDKYLKTQRHVLILFSMTNFSLNFLLQLFPPIFVDLAYNRDIDGLIIGGLTASLPFAMAIISPFVDSFTKMFG
jgi:hypothetical protein